MPRSSGRNLTAPSQDSARRRSKSAVISPPENSEGAVPAAGVRLWDNKAIAGILFETADLMEVDADDGFRVRSYRRAAEAIEALPQQVADLLKEPKRLLEVAGIGKAMLEHIQEMFSTGSLRRHQELLERFRPSMLELLKIQGLGPKTISLIWSTYQVSDLAGVERLAREGKLSSLPRMGEKQEKKILQAISDYQRISGRYLIDEADRTAEKLMAHLAGLPGIEQVAPAGSLRRGRETVGDLDLLITGSCCKLPAERDLVIDRVLGFPGITEVLVRGENKVSFRLRSGMQVDVRLLPPESFGAAMQYFTGSKSHNVALRQRALKLGYTLNEYALARLDTNERVAGRDEAEVYAALGLDYIPPELREASGEIEAAEHHTLPRLVALEDLRGDVHMHTVETDGRCTIEEMAGAARTRGYEYMAITEHSKNLAMARGLDNERALQHIERIHNADRAAGGIRIFAGIEVDILGDGALDLSDSVLAKMDLVIASVHSHFKQSPEEMTRRLLRAIENPNVSVVGHPTGRLLLRREAYSFDLDAILKAAAQNHVAMELNSFPDRLDLCDRHLRRARDLGVKIVINTDSHHTSHLENVKYGVLQARRAWLTPSDVLNTLPVAEFALAMKRQAI
ncbi:MAG: DNA polymerase/3'-5' exonuclease PolX [Terriglobales bacterium]|jgi:DNA polymerase (family 10)